MAKCASCGKNVLVGGVKEDDVRFCSQACRGKDFFNRYNAARTRAIAQNPNPLPAVRPSPKPREAPETTFEPDPLAEGASRLAIIGLGFLGVVAVVGLIWLIYQKVEYPFFAQTYLFVVPVGAFLCGMVAGIGFGLGHRQTNRLPDKLTYAAAGVAGTMGYVLIFGLSWWFATAGNARLHDFVGFPQYLQLMVENQRVQFRNGAPIDLGKWGYPRFAINLLGFAAGVVCMVRLAGMQAYCARCRRYFTKVGSQRRSTSDPEDAAAALYPVIAAIQAGRIQEALDLHAAWAAIDNKAFLQTTIAVEACSGCGTHVGTLSATCKTNNGVGAVSGLAFKGQTEERVIIPG
jgi:endogenous inhibitor of DNA gyrase (YacG/DUF329 family)